jgi:hypothetical protein
VIFLIEYNRKEAKLYTFKSYKDSDWNKASEDRLALELRLLHAGIDHEVVTLEADSEEDLRQTHGRYFDNLSELLKKWELALDI